MYIQSRYCMSVVRRHIRSTLLNTPGAMSCRRPFVSRCNEFSNMSETEMF